MFIEVFGISEQQLIVFLLIFVRILSLIIIAPLLGSQTIPSRIKAALAVFLTFIIWPTLNSQDIGGEVQLKSLFPLTIKEIVIGLFLGFNAKFFFEAFHYAGHLLSHQMGLVMSEMMNPESGAQVSPVDNLFSLIAVLLFIHFNGHYFIIAAIHKSFLILPIASTNLMSYAAGEKMLTLFNQIFVIGLKFAAPALAISFLIEVCMGIMARIVPQMNIFFIGLPLRLGTGLFVLMALIPVFYVFFTIMFNNWKLDLTALLNNF